MATRRDFVKMGSLAAVAGLGASSVLGATPDGLFGIPSDGRAVSASFYTGKNFKPFLNTVFKVVHKGAKTTVRLNLVQIKEKTHTSQRAIGTRTISTSLLFEGQKGRKLPQDVYELRHEKLGKFSVLLVPITTEGNHYEVVFNRI